MPITPAGAGLRFDRLPLLLSELARSRPLQRETEVMSVRHKPTDLVIPKSTASVLLPWSARPTFTRVNANFARVASEPSRSWLVTERIDPKDAPWTFNYNFYVVALTTSGPWLSSPRPTPTNFIVHHSSASSTWFDSLAVFESSAAGQGVLVTT
jgi:hypothetical protein